MKTFNLSLFIKKIAVCCTVILFTFTAVYVPQTHLYETPKAHAQADAWANIGNFFQGIYDSFTFSGILSSDLAQLGIDTAQWNVSSILNGLAWAAAKNILSMIQRDIVRWINSGFQGSPAFIQDLQGFVTNIADETMGQLIQEIGGPLSFICSPFQLDVRIALATAYNRTRDKNSRRCTLTGALQNIQNFIGGDMSQGGWNSWIRIVHQPQSYTPFGSTLEATAEAGIRIRTAQGQQVNILNWAGGFMSSKVCEPVAGPEGTTQRCRISTPGNVIANQLNRTLGLGDEALIAADQINEIIGALMQQMVTQVITGANGLLGAGGGQGGNSKYTNPNFNVDLYTPGMDIAVDTAAGRKLIAEALTAETELLALAQLYISRYENEISTDPVVQARAFSAYAEAVQLLPVAQSNVAKLETLLSSFDSTSDKQAQQKIIQDYTALGGTLSGQIKVDSARQQWAYAFTGMAPKQTPSSKTTLDAASIALTLEEEFLDLANAVIDEYETLSNPSPEDTTAYNEAQKILPDIQSNVITLRDIIDALEAGENGAEADFEDLKPELHTENDLEEARADWEAALGNLP
jgi:hypothetical protein